MDEPCRVGKRYMVTDQLFGFRDQIAGYRTDDVHSKHKRNVRSVSHRTADDGHGSTLPAHEHTRVSNEHRICGFLRIDNGVT